MIHNVDHDFRMICQEIVQEGKTPTEWAEVESDDMFQIGPYCGGFDATEMAFCFSFYGEEQEYWFQLSLDDVARVASGTKAEYEIRSAGR